MHHYQSSPLSLTPLVVQEIVENVLLANVVDANLQPHNPPTLDGLVILQIAPDAQDDNPLKCGGCTTVALTTSVFL